MASKARLTPQFLARAAATGMTDAALAAAIGVTPQYFSQVKAGTVGPSIRFLAGSVLAGLADDFGQVAEVDRREVPAAA